MEQKEVTIKQVADQCGVSKSTAVRKFKELNLPVVTRGGKGTVYLGPEAASALAHALVKSHAPETSDELMAELMDDALLSPVTAPTASQALQTETAYEPNTGAYEMYQEQIRTLTRTNNLLREQIGQLNSVIEVMQSQHESTVAVLSDQINHLNSQLAEIQREKDRMRDDLAMSRALEGFHFPWQRDRIVSRYLLPATNQTDVVNESESTIE